jgi:hypothetical protein
MATLTASSWPSGTARPPRTCEQPGIACPAGARGKFTLDGFVARNARGYVARTRHLHEHRGDRRLRLVCARRTRIGHAWRATAPGSACLASRRDRRVGGPRPCGHSAAATEHVTRGCVQRRPAVSHRADVDGQTAVAHGHRFVAADDANAADGPEAVGEACSRANTLLSPRCLSVPRPGHTERQRLELFRPLRTRVAVAALRDSGNFAAGVCVRVRVSSWRHEWSRARSPVKHLLELSRRVRRQASGDSVQQEAAKLRRVLRTSAAWRGSSSIHTARSSARLGCTCWLGPRHMSGRQRRKLSARSSGLPRTPPRFSDPARCPSSSTQSSPPRQQHVQEYLLQALHNELRRVVCTHANMVRARAGGGTRQDTHLTGELRTAASTRWSCGRRW